MRLIRWLALVPLAIGVLFGLLAVDRARLPYNSEGRYFDPQSGVVYQDSAPVAYGVLAVVSLLLACLLWFGSTWLARRRGSSS